MPRWRLLTILPFLIKYSSSPILIANESAYFLTNFSGSIVPVKVTHNTNFQARLWGSSLPSVSAMFNDRLPFVMSYASGIFSFTVRRGSNIYPAFANSSLVNAAPVVFDGVGGFVEELPVGGRGFMSALYPTPAGAQYTVFSVSRVTNPVLNRTVITIPSVSPEGVVLAGVSLLVPFSLPIGPIVPTAGDIVRDNWDAIPVVNNVSVFFVSLQAANAYPIITRVTDTTIAPTAQLVNIDAAVTTGSLVIGSSNMYFVEPSGNVYLLAMSGVLSFTAPLINVNPRSSECMGQLYFSASDPGLQYSGVGRCDALSSPVALTSMGQQFSPNPVRFPAPLVLPAYNSCIVAYYTGNGGWKISADYNDTFSFRRLFSAGTGLFAGVETPQSAELLAPLDVGFVLAHKTVRAGPRDNYFRQYRWTGVNPADASSIPANTSVQAEIRAREYFVSPLSGSKFMIVIDDPAGAFRHYDVSSPAAANGVIIPTLTNAMPPMEVHRQSLATLGNERCAIASTSAPTLYLVCYPSTNASASYIAMNLTVLLPMVPLNFAAVVRNGSSHVYYSTGNYILSIRQDTNNSTFLASWTAVSFIDTLGTALPRQLLHPCVRVTDACFRFVLYCRWLVVV